MWTKANKTADKMEEIKKKVLEIINSEAIEEFVDELLMDEDFEMKEREQFFETHILKVTLEGK